MNARLLEQYKGSWPHSYFFRSGVVVLQC